MIYNKITLSFNEPDESNFRGEYFNDSLFQFRIAFLLLIFLYGLFGYLDKQLVPEYTDVFHLIRYVFVVPILAIVWLMSFARVFQKVWQLLLFICTLIGGTGIVIMLILSPSNYTYYAGLMLVFSAVYFFIKLRFLYATIACWIVLVLYNIGTLLFTQTPLLLLINNNFFFVGANLIGMFAAYYIEYYARRNFFLGLRLEAEKSLVLEANKNLETMVDQRTQELVKARDKAEESDRLKSAFLANMSHEIRTPMNGILGFAELLKLPNLTGEQQQEYIRIIEKSGNRMLNIINDIVDISKIEAGLLQIDCKDSNINEQLEDIYMFFALEAKSKGIDFSYNTSLTDNQATIYTDREKVHAILSNLVKNALKYTITGKIEMGCDLKLDGDGGVMTFFVSDTGIGIPKDRQAAIFERFIQADIADKMARQGAGLGLAISRAYVEMLGGKIWVESEEGIGSTFYFSLPYISQMPTKPKQQMADNQKSNLAIRKLNVLIAEDDEVSDLLIGAFLKPHSKQILKVNSGLAAVETCRNNPEIDLVLMDIQMPEMNGYEAVRMIRMINQDVVIIAQTAFGLSGDSEKSIAVGCNDYMSKPISKTGLETLLQKHFGLKD